MSQLTWKILVGTVALFSATAVMAFFVEGRWDAPDTRWMQAGLLTAGAGVLATIVVHVSRFFFHHR